jgi:hypothetical protein
MDAADRIPETPVPYEARDAARASLDPLRYCVLTTIALLAWLVSPPVVVVLLAGAGFVMYARAIRGGLTRTRCVLRHPTLVLVYLALAFLAGGVGVWRLL